MIREAEREAAAHLDLVLGVFVLELGTTSSRQRYGYLGGRRRYGLVGRVCVCAVVKVQSVRTKGGGRLEAQDSSPQSLMLVCCG